MTAPQLHPDAEYWSRGESNVPDMTGAKHLLDARDLKAIFAHFGITVPFGGRVFDVGCGTGRLSQLCEEGCYLGLDIAQSAIDYCLKRGIPAVLIRSQHWLAGAFGKCDLVTCISVFTHIDRAERQAYLRTFATLTPKLLVDIIPGDGSGNVALWTANHDHFVEDLLAAGFKYPRWVDQAWDMHMHRYFYAERA